MRNFVALIVRLQLRAQAHNLGNFLGTLGTPEPIIYRLPITLGEKLNMIGANLSAMITTSPSR